MTFLTELKRLNAAIPAEKNALTRFGLIQQLDALLANNADAIAGLVEAAETVNREFHQNNTSPVRRPAAASASSAAKALPV